VTNGPIEAFVDVDAVESVALPAAVAFAFKFTDKIFTGRHTVTRRGITFVNFVAMGTVTGITVDTGAVKGADNVVACCIRVTGSQETLVDIRAANEAKARVTGGAYTVETLGQVGTTCADS
jgi:hypothetical protein